MFVHDPLSGETLCLDCAREFYHDELPGVVKHGNTTALVDWLQDHGVIPVWAAECDHCGAAGGWVVLYWRTSPRRWWRRLICRRPNEIDAIKQQAQHDVDLFGVAYPRFEVGYVIYAENEYCRDKLPPNATVTRLDYTPRRRPRQRHGMTPTSARS